MLVLRCDREYPHGSFFISAPAWKSTTKAMVPSELANQGSAASTVLNGFVAPMRYLAHAQFVFITAGEGDGVF